MIAAARNNHFPFLVEANGKSGDILEEKLGFKSSMLRVICAKKSFRRNGCCDFLMANIMYNNPLCYFWGQCINCFIRVSEVFVDDLSKFIKLK